CRSRAWWASLRSTHPTKPAAGNHRRGGASVAVPVAGGLGQPVAGVVTVAVAVARLGVLRVGGLGGDRRGPLRGRGRLGGGIGGHRVSRIAIGGGRVARVAAGG